MVADEDVIRTSNAWAGVTARRANWVRAKQALDEFDREGLTEEFERELDTSLARLDERLNIMDYLLGSLDVDAGSIDSVCASNATNITNRDYEIESIWKPILAEWKENGASENAIVNLDRMIKALEAGLREMKWFRDDYC
ncbi:MAG: hypothetical protein ACXAB9_13870 [Candidatus Thorarchaeota archaeon]|jgi:hypothetical protein